MSANTAGLAGIVEEAVETTGEVVEEGEVMLFIVYLLLLLLLLRVPRQHNKATQGKARKNKTKQNKTKQKEKKLALC